MMKASSLCSLLLTLGTKQDKSNHYLIKIISEGAFVFLHTVKFASTVKLGNKERFDKEQIGIKEPFSVTNLPFTS